MEKVGTKELKLVCTPIFPYQEVIQTKVFSVSDVPTSIQKDLCLILDFDKNKVKPANTQK